MSCNGCRALRKGCSESCILRQCLQWIECPQAQAHATVFVARFFGRSDLMSFISAVPQHHRPALFQSLLYEACGRTVNPVNGAVGLLWSGNWNVCQAAVETVLSGGTVRPISGLVAGAAAAAAPNWEEASEVLSKDAWKLRNAYFPSAPSMHMDKRAQPSDLDLAPLPRFSTKIRGGSKAKAGTTSFSTEKSVTTSSEIDDDGDRNKLLNLFV